MHVRSPGSTSSRRHPLPSFPVVPLIPVEFLSSLLNKQMWALCRPPYPGPQQARVLTAPLPVSHLPKAWSRVPPPCTDLGDDWMRPELGSPRLMTKANLSTSRKSSLSRHLRLISQAARLTPRTVWVTCPCFTGGCSLPNTRHRPQEPLTPGPEGVLPLGPGSQRWVVIDFHRVPTPVPSCYEGLNSPGRPWGCLTRDDLDDPGLLHVRRQVARPHVLLHDPDIGQFLQSRKT